MAKPTAYATPICIAASIILAIGIILGLALAMPLIIVLCLLPAVIYEAYRTEGESTKWAAWSLLGLIVLEVIAVIFNLKVDLAKYLGSSGQYIYGYYLPLGDIRVIFPAVMAVLAIILFVQTRGVYTRWLAALIIIGSLAAVYVIDAQIFQQLLRQGIEQGLRRIQ